MYINDLDIFLYVKLVEDSPAVLSLGMLCEEVGYSVRNAGGHPSFAKDGFSIERRSDKHVPVVARTKQRGTSAYSDSAGDSLPGWLQPFTEWVRDEKSQDEVQLPRDHLR